MDYTKHNQRILSDLKSGMSFYLLEKAVTFPKLEGEYCEVIFGGEEWEWCGYYTMVLVHPETPVGGDWDIVDGTPTDNLGYPIAELKRIKENWIPLPILFELLRIEWEWDPNNSNLRTTNARKMIEDKIDIFSDYVIPTNRKENLAKKVGQVF